MTNLDPDHFPDDSKGIVAIMLICPLRYGVLSVLFYNPFCSSSDFIDPHLGLKMLGSSVKV